MITILLKVAPEAGALFSLVFVLGIVFVLWLVSLRKKPKEKKFWEEPTGSKNGGGEFLPHIEVKEGDQLHPIRR